MRATFAADVGRIFVGTHLVAVGNDIYDVSKTKAGDLAAAAAVDTFETSTSDGLASAVACTKASLLVAPSMRVHNQLGFFAARPFVKGEVVCLGASMETLWIPAECQVRWGLQKLEYSLNLTLRNMFFAKQYVSMQLIGDPNRNLWARMNSIAGLWQHSSVEPNIEMYLETM